MNRINALLLGGAHRLSNSESARLDCELLLMHVLKWSRAQLYSCPEHAVSDQQQAAFEALLQRRQKGEPIAYLLGEKEFWSLDLSVTPDVLIPRSDTELLVELALNLNLPAHARVADLGTGSGAIALALAHARSDWQVLALDICPKSLEVAKQNKKRHRLENLHFCLGHWCKSFREACFDLIVSNPPYIDANDTHLKQPDLSFEPRSALVAQDLGLGDLEPIIATSVDCLTPGGTLIVEHGSQQAQQVQHLFSKAGFKEVTTHRDLAGLERATMGLKP